MTKRPRPIRIKPGTTAQVKVKLGPYEVYKVEKLDHDSTNLDAVSIIRRAHQFTWCHQAIAGRGEFRVGDEVAYIPAGLLVWLDDEAEYFNHLVKDYVIGSSYYHKVRERRFRGVTSPGIVVPWGWSGPHCLSPDSVEVVVSKQQRRRSGPIFIPEGWELLAPYYPEIGRRIRPVTGGRIMVEHNGRWIDEVRLASGKAKGEAARAKKVAALVAPGQAEGECRKQGIVLSSGSPRYTQFIGPDGIKVHIFVSGNAMAVMVGELPRMDGPDWQEARLYTAHSRPAERPPESAYYRVLD